jgi:bacterioferritin-associated ferredoxin
VLVCHCHQVSDRTIRTCIRSGAESVAAVGERCGAGTSCGGCRPTIEAMVGALVELRHLPVFEGFEDDIAPAPTPDLRTE